MYMYAGSHLVPAGDVGKTSDMGVHTCTKNIIYHKGLIQYSEF